jgi:hypothetical protein
MTLDTKEKQEYMEELDKNKLLLADILETKRLVSYLIFNCS